jgi:hypothetical protein
MDNGLTIPYPLVLATEDGAGQHQLGVGSPSASYRGVERRRKRCELRCETGSLRRISDEGHTSKKSPDCHKYQRPVPETDTGGVVENTEGREITLSKELGKMTP